MKVTFAEDADLELFDQLQGWCIEVTLTPQCKVGRFRILGIEETEDGDNVLYGFPADEDWSSPGYDKFLSTKETDLATALPIDLIDELVIWP